MQISLVILTPICDILGLKIFILVPCSELNNLYFQYKFANPSFPYDSTGGVAFGK